MKTLFKSTVIGLTATMLLAACQQKTDAADHDHSAHKEAASAATHDGHGMAEKMALPANASAATKAYAAAMGKMHKDMAIAYSNDADRDFLAGMIPHHQGAIDMARIVLEHGKDPEVRKLAQAVITAQEAEITQMQAWVDQKPKPE
jgi:uncharacterized protein (DUF305 family)